MRRYLTLATGFLVAAASLALVPAAPAAAAPKLPSSLAELISGARTREAKVPAPPRPARTRPTERTMAQSLVKDAAEAAAPTKVGGGAAAGPTATANTLVLYDTTGPYGWLGEVYAVQVAQLASHFGRWTAHPVATYQPGEIATYTATYYVGSTYDEPLPTTFLDEVLAGTKPVTWLYDNIWQLTARAPAFAATYGFMWKQFDFATVQEVRYKGTSLTRDTLNNAGLMDMSVTTASVLGTAVRDDGTTLPWAVRSGALTYVGEIPFAYVTHDDRYLAFADMMYDPLAPATAARHRGLVRIEDVGPDADPKELRAVADYLYSQKVPFSVAVYPLYKDPKGVNSGGRPTTLRMKDAPAVVSALKYMAARGGTLLMHGYTHQYGSVANPYDGVSANDFEFYRAHIDAADDVVYDGPVAEDSYNWAAGRIMSAYYEFAAAGLPQPKIFEFPHYAGSVPDYAAARDLVGPRYDRTLYFPGALSGAAPDYTRQTGQFFPYLVRDVYGSVNVPENIGNVEPEASNNHPPRLPSDLIASAKRNLAIRDGVASFFYHPYLGTDYLKTTVTGIKALGYTFVSAGAVQAG